MCFVFQQNNRLTPFARCRSVEMAERVRDFVLDYLRSLDNIVVWHYPLDSLQTSKLFRKVIRKPYPDRNEIQPYLTLRNHKTGGVAGHIHIETFKKKNHSTLFIYDSKPDESVGIVKSLNKSLPSLRLTPETEKLRVVEQKYNNINANFHVSFEIHLPRLETTIEKERTSPNITVGYDPEWYSATKIKIPCKNPNKRVTMCVFYYILLRK